MIEDAAFGVKSARAGARVAALIVQAGFRTFAIVVRHALWPTAGVRIAEVLGQADARAGAVAFAADGVRSARRRIARVSGTLGSSN